MVATVELCERWPGRLPEPSDLRVEHCGLAGESGLPLILSIEVIIAQSDGNQVVMAAR